MNRIDRLAAILIQLQSKRIVKAQEIADRFEITLRTVYRDVKALQEAGIPVGVEPGRGYYIMEGYFLPPVMFTKDEAAALLIGGKFIEKMSDDSMNKEFKSALFKIKSIMRSTDKDYLSNLDASIGVSSNPGNFQPTDKYLMGIQKAVVNSNRVEIKYYTLYSDVTSTRAVDPVGAYYYGNSWHLIAYCHKRNDYRDFRLDRIKEMKILSEQFNPAKILSLQEYLEKMKSEYKLQKAEIEVDNSIVRFVDQNKFYQGFSSEIKNKDTTRMIFMIGSEKYFASWVITLGTKVKIISPVTLKNQVTEMISELSNFYKN